MKDPHGRIARWFTLLAEYDLEICYRAGRDNACADFLSRPLKLMVIGDHQTFEANLKAITHYLDNLSVVDEPISITPEVETKAKDFLVHYERLFRSTKYGIRFVPHIEMRERILKGLHDEFGHWDFNSTYPFLRDRFLRPSMRQKIANFVKNCDTFQKANQRTEKNWPKEFLLVDYSTPGAQTLQGRYPYQFRKSILDRSS